MKANHISDFHANTHIPIVIGAQMRYEIIGDEVYKAGSFLSIGKSWSEGDEIALEFPLGIRIDVIQDDRPEFTSLQAIIYGPCLLGYLRVTMTSKPNQQFSLGISYSEDRRKELFLLNSDRVITLEGSPQAGNDSYVHASFRLTLEDPSKIKVKFLGPYTFIRKTIMFEPYDRPGMVVARKGTGEGPMINSDFEKGSPEFLTVKGLSGEDGMISLQTKDGCFVYTSSLDVKLNCETGSLDDKLKLAASFIWNKGLRKYHPNSFVAKGVRRSYVLEPLLGLRDETYNVYFNITN